MKIGLTFGKYLPLSYGHLALIKFASERCDLLYVMVCANRDEEISGELRYKWMLEETKHLKNIKVLYELTDLPANSTPDRDVSKIWSEYFLERIGKFDFVFTSEDYGKFVAEYTDSENILYDKERKNV